MMSLPLYPPVQAKLAGGSAGDGPENEDAASSQGAGEKAPADGQAQPKANRQEPNRTGMPDRLKTGIEALSGIDMSGVRVHANSPKPARLGALAYTQGNQIYMGPGQERHLPHEAWHAVQQKQGRVRATEQLEGVGVNDEERLEWEADFMGRKAFQMREGNSRLQDLIPSSTSFKPSVIQRMITRVVMTNGSLTAYGDSKRCIGCLSGGRQGDHTLSFKVLELEIINAIRGCTKYSEAWQNLIFTFRRV